MLRSHALGSSRGVSGHVQAALSGSQLKPSALAGDIYTPLLFDPATGDPAAGPLSPDPAALSL